MLFNAVEYFIFLPIVALLYFRCPARWRWLLLLMASYSFYMYWRADYALLILASTVIDYWAARKMSRIQEKPKRKKWLALSLIANLGMLFTFKYFNLISTSLNVLLDTVGLSPKLPSSSLLLPIGISFYTFQTLSYSIDVYRGRIAAEKHFGKFALFVSFFPQLVAGPIERAGQLLPQFSKKFSYDHERVKNGCLLMLSGLFKKVVIADRMAEYIQFVYANPENQLGGDALIATYFFAIQVYCDFSGYSDIAVGTAQVLGFRLSENFKRPFYGQSLQEVWSRWHVTLINWFRDYLFIPLSRMQPKRVFVNIMVVYLATGLWHGASWKFFIWGGINGIIIYVSRWLKKRKLSVQVKWAWLNRFIAFNLFCLSVPFFCAKSTTDALLILEQVFTNFSFSKFAFRINASYYEMFLVVASLGALAIVHHYQEHHGSVRTWLSQQVLWKRWIFYYILIFSIILFGWFDTKEFVYFQF